VKFEGKNVHLLSDPMTNNGGGSGSPANSATMQGVVQTARAKNPGNEDVCGAGNHSEKVHYPDVPKNEWNPKRRLEVIKSQIRHDGDVFECRAAEHNINDGSITHGKQLSRRITPDEKSADAHEDDQKIWMVCATCGYRREVDQAPDKNHTVEAKSTTEALKGSIQKTNNATLVRAGRKVTYKSPPIAKYDQYQSLIEKGFEVIQLAL